MLVPVIKRNFKFAPKTTETEQQQEQGTGNGGQGTGEDEGKGKREEGRGKREEVKKMPEQKQPEQKQPEKKSQDEKPAAPAQPSTAPAQPSAPPVKPGETRGSIYLIQKSNMMLVKVNRNLNANTPLTDSINALLAGPAPDEIMRGIESLVPEGSRLLSVRVDGSTAYLDFNQEFRYNQHGSEGCAAQIKQIVWTATEFPNVRNVQFLIEGKKVDFLSEGVVINSPIGR
jgi:Spore germination protein